MKSFRISLLFLRPFYALLRVVKRTRMDSFARAAPMRWIFSDSTPSGATSTVPKKLHSIDLYDEAAHDLPSYGPQLKRKGNIRFIKARGDVQSKGNGNSGEEHTKPKRSLYDDLAPPLDVIPRITVQTPIASTSRARLPSSVTPDLDLTLSSSDESDDSDDDLTFYDPRTSLPLPRVPLPRVTLSPVRRPHKSLPKSISDLLSDFTPQQAPVIVPTQYGIGANTIGWRMLARQGWREGEGLGRGAGSFVLDDEGGLVKAAKDRAVEGIKVPIQAVERMHRSGLGIVQNSTKGYRARDNGVKLKKKGKRERGREREKQEALKVVQKRAVVERRDRKELLAYLNH